MNNRLINTALFIASTTLFLASCSEDNSAFETPNTSETAANSGVISQNNFSLLTADVAPAVIDATTGIFTKTDVELTVFIGDRNNQVLTDSHVINFVAEYGLVEPSCTTEDGSCSVTWSAIKRPDFSKPGSPGADGVVTITAYTIGEEGFTDTNGNNVFDDADASFDDIEEPYVDANESNLFNIGDPIIDVVSTNDPTGANNTHDIADGFYNGVNCTHTSLCGTAKSITVFDDVSMSLIANVIESRTIGGTVAGFNAASTALVLQNNGADNFTVAANGTYTFATTVDDAQTYAVTVLTQPTTPGQVCTVANATGTVSANVTNANVTCVTDAYTIGGGVITNLLGTGLVLRNNGGDDLTIANSDTSYTFATPVDEGATYAVTPFTQPSSPNQTCAIANDTGTVSAADVTNANISCTTTQYTIGGSITGIGVGEDVTLRNNGGDDLMITADGSFTFATAIADGATYTVTIPVDNTGGACTAGATNTGTVSGANVVSVVISCP